MDKWLSNPNVLKIVSVVLALFLWAAVNIDTDSTQQTVTSSDGTRVHEAVKISATGIDEGRFILTAMEPTTAKLTTRGRVSDLLLASSPDDYHVQVDLTNVKAGIQELPLTVSAPKGIEVIMEPHIVTVQIEELIMRTHELEVRLSGEASLGYQVLNPIIASEKQIKVTLPQSDMERFSTVAVMLDLDGADKSIVNKRAKIVALDTDGQEISNAVLVPNTAEVEVPISLPSKSVPVSVRTTGTLPEGLGLVSLTPQTGVVTVYGTQDAIDRIESFDAVVIDLSKVQESGTLQVKPGSVEGIAFVDPAEIAVDVVVSEIGNRTMYNLPIRVEGLSDDLTARIISPANSTFDLVLSGAQAILSQVKATDIRLRVDASDLTAGDHSLPLSITVPANVTAVQDSGQSYTVEVKISEKSSGGTEGNEQANGGEDEEEGTPVTTETDPSSSPKPTSKPSATPRPSASTAPTPTPSLEQGQSAAPSSTPEPTPKPPVTGEPDATATVTPVVVPTADSSDGSASTPTAASKATPPIIFPTKGTGSGERRDDGNDTDSV